MYYIHGLSEEEAPVMADATNSKVTLEDAKKHSLWTTHEDIRQAAFWANAASSPHLTEDQCARLNRIESDLHKLRREVYESWHGLIASNRK
jgi:hypothetical protein